MTTFDSSRSSHADGPWSLSCPFDLSGLRATSIIPDEGGSVASFRDGLSTSSGSSSEHLSAALGLTVGYPFLNASVTGQYDRDILENENVRNDSTHPAMVFLG